MRRALQHLGAPLELLAQLLLHRREILERVTRLLAIHLLRRRLELLHLCHQLRRHRLLEQRLGLAELARERRVECARRLELLLELLRRLTKTLHPIGHRALFLRETSRPFRVVEIHRLLLRARTAGGRRLRAALSRLRARRFAGALGERLLRTRRGLRLLHGGVAEGACRGTLLLGRRAAKDYFATHAALCPGRRIHCFGAHPHRVAGRKMQRADVHRGAAAPARAHRTGERLHDGRGVLRSRAHHAQRHGRNAMVVRYEHRERDRLPRHEQRIGGGLRDDDMRRRIGDDIHAEWLGQIGHEATRTTRRPMQQHGMIGRELSAERLSGRGKRHALAALPEQCDIREWNRRAARYREHAAARQMQRLANRERLRGAAEIARIVHGECDGADEWAVGGVHDHTVAHRAAIRRNETQVAAQRVNRPRRRTRGGIDRDGVRPPGVAGLANLEIHHASSRRAHREMQRRATQELARRAVDARPIEQAAAPCVDGAQHGAQPVAEEWCGGEEHQQSRRRRARPDDGALGAGAAHRRRQWCISRQRTAHAVCGPFGERAVALQLEHADERATAHSLLCFDCQRDVAARSVALEAAARAEREHDDGRDHDKPHRERQTARQREPSGAPQQDGSDREQHRHHRGGEQRSGGDLGAPQMPSLALDQRLDRHGTGRLVTA